MVKKMIYGDRLREIRENKEISQFDLSKVLNLHDKVYGQYEREYVIMPIKHLNTICNYLNVSLDYVFGFSNSINYSNYKDKIDKKVLGERLKKMRKARNLTQHDIAKVINAASSVIAGAEQGRRLLATPFLYTICKTYKVSADYLVGKINSPKDIT